MNCITQPFKSEGKDFPGSPVVKTLLSQAGGAGSIPGSGAKNHKPCAFPHQKKKNIYIYIKQNQYCNKFNEDF